MPAASRLQIRAYEPSDETAVLDLWERCGLLVAANDPRRDIQRKCAVDPEGLLLGLLAGKIVATCMAGYEGHRGWINYLAVLPKYRRQGLGTRMMDAAEKRLKAAGCPKVNLQVRETNAAIIGFYEKIGFLREPVVSLGKRLVDDVVGQPLQGKLSS
jgi:ribosomal protein S18 acetylase RimI-like enzyme